MTEPGRPPLLSLVLPVHAVARYLPACLDSILGQPAPAGGLEVIAVDDASPDDCGAILDRRAAADPRLRVVHLARRVGPGPARMRGLALARGGYVWFADPDDALAPGCLAAIGDRLARDRPDVLLLDYLTVYPGGRAEPSHGRALLAGGPGTLTLAGRPELLARTMTAWSKVISRPFLAGLEIGFPPGIHEDVAFSCVLLLCAARIALFDRVCYLYQRRAGAFLATPGPAHFDIFRAYENVFEFTARTGVAAPVAAAVFGRAVEHYSSILASGLVPRPARREYFGRMAAEFRRHRPPGYRRPPGLRGLRVRLIERDSYRLYSLLAPVNAARVRLRGPLPGGGAAKSLPGHTREK